MEVKVSGMTCGGCVKSVTNALKALDQNAEVSVSLETQTIQIKTSKETNDVKHTIEEAGFDVLNIQ
ncbi:MAG: heavy-metal-associated domain-containing protein [Bacteriovoracaceae bacterium]|jgi:copper chaperone|nr:heavy-metal-associated domain-containing protein [Bacteriovoracaceae bacterium]